MVCLPFVIALVIHTGSIVSNVIDLSISNKCNTICGTMKRKFTTRSHIMNIISSLILISLTYVLCSRGHNNWAWFVILFPLVLAIIYTIVIISSVKEVTIVENNCPIIKRRQHQQQEEEHQQQEEEHQQEYSVCH
jgi:hypothetical protein